MAAAITVANGAVAQELTRSPIDQVQAVFGLTVDPVFDQALLLGTGYGLLRAAPDGTIIGRRLVKSSGLPTWDEAVLRAIDKTEVLPRDTDGRVPGTLLLVFQPRD